MAKTASRASRAALPGSQVHEPEVVGAPVSEEQSVVSSNLDSLTTFISGMVPFFRTASQLEVAARTRLGAAQAFEAELKADGVTIPRTANEDALTQVMIRASKLGRVATDAHWTITSVLSKLHKATVAGRERAGTLDDQAAAIAQRLHNGYTEAAKRKAREQEEADRRIAEQRARDERDREQRELEEAALRAEAASPELSDRERVYVEKCAQGYDVLDAARVAGFKNPQQAVSKLLVSPKINAAIKATEDALTIRRQAAARAAMPLDVQVTPVKPDIQRATSGSHDRTTWAAEVYDQAAFMAAILDPLTRTQFGIPADCAMINQVKLNEVARGLHEKMNTWPGVRAKSTTTTV